MFLGFVQLEDDLTVPLLVKDSSGSPVNGDALPTWRAYGPDGLMQDGSGTASKKDSGSISSATNASPIVVTSTAHGLTTGTRATITGALGNTAANGTFTVTSVSTDTFSLDGSTGSGAYTSGGAWNVSGLYTFTLPVASADGYEVGQTYSLLSESAISSTPWANLDTFTVT